MSLEQYIYNQLMIQILYLGNGTLWAVFAILKMYWSSGLEQAADQLRGGSPRW